MSYCMRGTLVKWDGKTITTHPLRCKCWTCESCAPWRRKRLIDEARAGKPQTFITLTSNPHYLASPNERAHQLVLAWRQIVRRLRASGKHKQLQYLVVMERTAQGEPHLHILARMGFVPQKVLSEWMRELANAPIVDIRRIRSAKKAALYVTKYVGKDPFRYDGCKRYWRSNDYMHPTRAELRAQQAGLAVWYAVPMPYHEYNKRLKKEGWRIIRDWPTSIIVEVPPWVDCPPGTEPILTLPPLPAPRASPGG